MSRSRWETSYPNNARRGGRVRLAWRAEGFNCWYLVTRTWYQVPGIPNELAIPAAQPLLQGSTWYLVPGTRYQVPPTRRPLPATERYLQGSTLYSVPGT